VYFEAKTMLASSINIEPDELVDQMVEGIPAQNLRDQARIQCFKDPMQILRAFAGIRLDKPKETASKELNRNRSDNVGFCCGNCNARGHIAKNCRKTAWEPASCYAYGKFGHFVAQCEERTGNAENRYVRYIKIHFYSQIISPMVTACILDSGSPISLLKISLLPREAQLQDLTSCKYFTNLFICIYVF